MHTDDGDPGLEFKPVVRRRSLERNLESESAPVGADGHHGAKPRAVRIPMFAVSVVAIFLIVIATIVIATGLGGSRHGSDESATTAPPSTPEATPNTVMRSTAPSSAGPSSTAPSKDKLEPADSAQLPVESDGRFSNPSGSGRMWSSTVRGILTFRGNPTRTYYGRGPVPVSPRVLWSYPDSGGMCSNSSVGGETKLWCGSGWTGQPSVFERDGRTWVVFGAYDRSVHFMDGRTGEDILPPFRTGDIIKGSVTIDPDGFPLVYSGSRDDFFHVIAIDRDGKPEELWKLSAKEVSPTLWNNDWDGSALVLDDFLFIGGENSQFHVVKLNRGYGSDGKVTVDPKLVFNAPSWDQQLIDDLAGNRAREFSIENSVAISGDTAYWANSGGLVMGWDMGPLRAGGTPSQTFRFWTGDDTDASIVIDPSGFLYVAVEYERGNQRSAEVGQLMKLDPGNNENPIVWTYHDRESRPAGFWATPALHDGVVIAPTNEGKVVALDQITGIELWSISLPGPTWQSPVVVDDVLIQGDCDGVLHGYDVTDPRTQPPEIWSVDVGGCIESTPAVWNGHIYFGTRAGRFFALGDPSEVVSPFGGP